ncbi:MAG: UTRA domain-containing protein [Actinomycetota bacterium]|nr:UTRA domain-containing protein [Actinomycetota bacterium]
MLFIGTAPSPQNVAERMEVEAGAELFVRRRLMYVDGVPVRVATSYFLVSDAEATPLEEPDFLPQGLQEILEQMGKRFGRAEETLIARAATPGEARVLELDASASVVEILRTSYDSEGAPVHTLETICAAERHVFRVRQFPDDRAF